MKKLLTILAASLMAGSAFAAETSPIRLGSALGDRGQTVALTNVVPASSTESTLVGSPVDIREWDRVGLLLSFASPSAGTANTTLTFARSGSKELATAVFETTPRFTWVVAANGTNTVVGFTNLPNDSLSGVSFLKLISVGTGTNIVTNLTVTVTRKRN